MSLALARKYRPKNFASVVVQTHVSNTLKGAIARNRVAHGYLLCGPRGTGKTTLARVLAMALNCERRAERTDGEPCGECSSCTRTWSGSASLDVVEIDAASNRGVDDARDLRERAMYAPSGDDRYKVYIVDEAHMLTREAWNALLKILEEPPPRVVFVFATTEPQKIAQTAAPVLSRLQRFDLKRIAPVEIRSRLAEILALEQVTAAPEALAMIARAADGSMRDALSLVDQVLALGDGAISTDRVRDALGLVAEDEFIALLDLVIARDAGAIFAAVARLADQGIDFGAFLAGFAELLRGQLEIVLGGEAADLSERTRDALRQRASGFSAADLLRMLNAVTELEPRFRKSGQQQLLLEALLVRFALLDRAVEIEDILRGLGRGGVGDADRPLPGVGRPAAPVPGRGRRASGDAVAREEVRRGAPAGVAGSEPGATLGSAATAAATPLVAASLADVADAPASATADAARTPLDLNRLAEVWDDVLARVRRAGKIVLAAALEHTVPVAVTAAGDVALQIDASHEGLEPAIDANAADLVRALGEFFTGVARIQLRGAAGGAPPRRLTEEAIRDQRISSLRKKDPVLDAAIDALDLELLE
jgi:DNA polymerase III subunit gamma/tau